MVLACDFTIPMHFIILDLFVKLCFTTLLVNGNWDSKRERDSTFGSRVVILLTFPSEELES